MNKNHKEIRGITLIALIITIIVLLILAGVSIVALTGENGIITRAVKSRQTSAEADAKEEVARVISALLIDNTGDYSKITPNDIVTELNKDNDRKITSSSTTFPTNIIYPATNTINKIEITINKDMSIGNIESSGGNTGGSNHYDNEVVTATQKELQQLFTWNIENGKAIITGMNVEYINETFTPKDNIEGNEGDSDYIYKNDKRLTTLIIPYEIEDNGKKYAVTEIGRAAFADHNGISGTYGWYTEKIVLPNTITTIQENAFGSNSLHHKELKWINIPNSVISIEEAAFLGNAFLRDITIPNSVTSMGYDVFDECTKLDNIYCYVAAKPYGWSENWLGDRDQSIVKWLGGNVDAGYYENEAITSTQKELQQFFTYAIENGRAIITGMNEGNINETFSPKDNVEGNQDDNDYIYKNDKRLTTLIIPYEIEDNGQKYTVTEIGDAALGVISSGYSWYTEKIVLPKTLTKIGNHAFYGTAYKESGTRMLKGINIPEKVESIGEYAFYGCHNLEKVTIQNSVTSIGRSAFASCENLRSIQIPSNLNTIEDGTFYGCESLTDIRIPESVTSINYVAFAACSSLKNVTIPKNVITIKDKVFDLCSTLQNIYCEAASKPYGWSTSWLGDANRSVVKWNQKLQ